MTEPFDIASGQRFNLNHGFLPAKDPIYRLPKSFSAWEEVSQELPKLLASDSTRDLIDSLPKFSVSALKDKAEYERAMLILSYLGHAYVWCNDDVVDTLPSSLALPWFRVAKKIGRPPVLSYASYALYNWHRIDSDRPVELGNIALLQNFLGGLDEEWFILIHIDIEAKAAPGLKAIQSAQTAVAKNDKKKLISHLQTMSESLDAMCKTLERMPEHCDPYIYFNRVRPYIHGWHNNPALPNGLKYSGVKEYNNRRQQFKGETGAQSTIVPCFDAALGIAHENNPLKKHLDEMRKYMPPDHRKFLEAVERGASLREFIIQHYTNYSDMRHFYNECIQRVEHFRKIHLGYAAQYIQKQSQISTANPTSVGTGGTPFMDYLRKHRLETEKFLI